jgi:hypothetical protein
MHFAHTGTLFYLTNVASHFPSARFYENPTYKRTTCLTVAARVCEPKENNCGAIFEFGK